MSDLKDVLARAQHWPPSSQDKLLQAALEIEKIQDTEFELTAEDWIIIEDRISKSDRGEIATDEEMEAIFKKYRQT